jgi:ABC-type branched-subunit amino acid transport system ATPase component/ABC-type branched-subunit amino acid transport system permease subunit
VKDGLIFLLTGFGAGSIFSALALGLVLTYKGTGVINFAAGAMGAWSAYVYNALHTAGNLAFPVIGIPGSVHLFGSGLGAVPAILIAGCYGAVLGLLVYLLVFRPIRKAPVLAKVVASVGVMLAMQALIVERFGNSPQIVDPILPASDVQIGNLGISEQVFWLAGIVIVVTALLALWFRTARTGLGMRAAADSEFTASLAGFSPNLLGSIAWAGGSAIVGFLVVLATPIAGLNATSYTLYVIPALACALVGRLKAIGPAVAAGLALGMIDAEITFLSSKSWWPSWAGSSVSDAIPFLAIVVILFLLGKSLPTREDAGSGRLPRVPRPRIRPGVVLVLLGVGAAVLAATSGTIRFGLIITLAMGVVILSIVVLTGLLGQVSLAQAAFAGIGGFALSKLSVQLGIGFPWAPLLAAVVAALVGVVAGLPALRIRGIQLAVVTLAMALAFEQVLFSNPSFNGLSGNPVNEPTLFGLNLSIRSGSDIARLPFGLLCLAVVCLAGLGVTNLMRSSTGRRFLAVRSNERASAAAGVGVTATKLIGFGLSAFLAGLGGTLIAYSYGSVSVESFTTLVGISWLVFSYLGGITSVGGALSSSTSVTLGIVFVVINRFVTASNEAYLLVSAVALILTVIFNPEGVAGRWRALVARSPLGRRSRAEPLPIAETVGPEPLTEPFRAAPETTQAWSGERSGRLTVSNLRVRYGGLVAVDDVSLAVESGRIVGLIGANGAGKTTVIDAVSGFTACRGTVSLSGRPLDGRGPHRRTRAGLARTWQSAELFEDLTVLENLQVACEDGSVTAALRDCLWPKNSGTEQIAIGWLRWFGLDQVAGRFPAELSLGQRKLVNLARALARTPKIVLADEPAAGLSSAESAALGRALKRVVAAHDVGVLLVDHDVGLVTEICDYIYVLSFGTLIAEGTPAEIRSDPVVIASYLGSEFRAADQLVASGRLVPAPAELGQQGTEVEP